MLSRSILYANDPVFSIRKEKKHFCSLILSLPLSLLPSIIAFHRKIHRRLHYIYIYIAPITIVDCKVWTNTHTHTQRKERIAGMDCECCADDRREFFPVSKHTENKAFCLNTIFYSVVSTVAVGHGNCNCLKYARQQMVAGDGGKSWLR